MATPSTVYDNVRAAFAGDAWLAANVHLCDDPQNALERFAELAMEWERAAAENPISVILEPGQAARQSQSASSMTLTQSIRARIFINPQLAGALGLSPMFIVNEIARLVWLYRPTGSAAAKGNYLQLDSSGLAAVDARAGIISAEATWSQVVVQ